MKKVILTSATVFAIGFANAQEQTAKGKILIEANTGFGTGVGSTSIGFTSKIQAQIIILVQKVVIL